jgi:hypothetical protein
MNLDLSGAVAGLPPVASRQANVSAISSRIAADTSIPVIARFMSATVLSEHDGWRVMADPEGNEFDATRPD